MVIFFDLQIQIYSFTPNLNTSQKNAKIGRQQKDRVR